MSGDHDRFTNESAATTEMNVGMLPMANAVTGEVVAGAEKAVVLAVLT